MLKNVEKCWKMLIVENITKNVEMLKCWQMLVRKLIFTSQIILFFDMEFKNLLLILIFTNIYSHL